MSTQMWIAHTACSNSYKFISDGSMHPLLSLGISDNVLLLYYLAFYEIPPCEQIMFAI